MEQLGNHEEHLTHDLHIVSPEQVALQALVDRLFQDSDQNTFEAYRHILESTHDGEA